MRTCLYYQANINRSECWFFVAVLRSMEHLAFDRTLDKDSSLFEFFVPHTARPFFENMMKAFEQSGVVLSWKSLPNRLKNRKEQV